MELVLLLRLNLLKRFVCCFVLIAMGLVNSVLVAQADHDVAHWLDRDTTALLNIADVPTTFDRISELDLFSNPRFLKAIEMLSDERFPILNSDDVPRVFEKLDEFESLAKKIHQVSFAIHQYNQAEFTWTVFFRGDEESLESLQGQLSDADQLLRETVKFATAEQGKEGIEAGAVPTQGLAFDQPEEEPEGEIGVPKPLESSDIKNLGWCKIRQVGDWLVVSNHPSFVYGLPDRINDQKFRSLGKARKYRAVMQSKSPLNRQDGRVSIYAMPVNLLEFFPQYTVDSWEMLKVKEMPSCALNIVIADQSSDTTDSVKPIILADAIVKFTEPASGYSKMLEHYDSFEIPPLAVEPIELVAFSRDEAPCVEEGVKNYDAKYGKGKADNYWATHFLSSGIDVFEDAIPRRKAMFQMRFVDEKHSIDRPGLLTLDSVKDFSASMRYAEGINRLCTESFGRKLLKTEMNGATWWQLNESEFDANSGIDYMVRTLEKRFDLLNAMQDAYALSNDWFAHGDMPAVKQQMELCAGGEGKDFGVPIREMMRDMSKRLKPNGPIVMAKYFTPKSWQENINSVELAYSYENTTEAQFEFDPTKMTTTRLAYDMVELKSEDGSSRYELQAIPAIRLESGQANLEPMDPKDSPIRQIKDDEERSATENAQLISIQLPMALGPRNKDGYRFNLNEQWDLQKAIEVMLLTSIAESFPRQMFLYAKEDGHFRVLAGAYAQAPESETPASESN